MNLNDLFNEEKVRLDPHCWDNKKIGNPKTKVKGGVRVNNCVPKESVSEAPLPGQRRDPLDLQPLEGGSASGGSLGSGIGPRPVEPLPKWTPTRIPGVDVHTGPPPTVTKPPNINSKIDPAADVPAYVRQGKPDPVTTPVGKPKIQLKPGETMDQAVQRTKSEQEFGKFLKGQGEQTFGTQPAAQTSGSNQIPTIRLPNGQTIPDPARVSPSGQYGHLDKIARDDERAVDAMVKKARENAQTRDAAQANKEKQLGLEPGSLRPRSQWEQERAAALRSEEEKLGLPPGSLSSRSQRQPEQTTTPPESKKTDSILSKLLGGGLEEASPKKREPPEAKYDDEYDAMVARVRKLAGLGPMKTVYDPNKRQYRNMPTAQQPQKK